MTILMWKGLEVAVLIVMIDGSLSKVCIKNWLDELR